ncbi:MAG: histidinol phosphatase [SAR202 cluster bacterium]|nr:histidinol phosphatase [SAR202 cluster bacterium]
MSFERDLTADLELALRLADIADEISLKRFEALDLIIESKPDLSPVTDADKAVEVAIRAAISQARVGDLVVGEEFGSPDSLVGKYYWVIDPIDGTKNYLRGVPTWATLIGLINPEGRVVVGVVSAPALVRRWWAAEGTGAKLKFNGELRDIQVSKVSKLNDASISYSDLIGWGTRREKFLALQEKIWRTRGHGDFWSHMLVAQGAVDLAVEPSLALWDMAALDVIIREAGGKFTNISGEAGPHGGSAISSNGLVHEAFMKEIN